MKGWIMSKEHVKNALIVVCLGAAFYAGVQHLDAVWGAVKGFVGVFAPFLLGGAIAFVLNVPMRAIEKHVFPKERQMDRLRRPLALIFSLLAVIGALVVALYVIIPGVKEAVVTAAGQLPDAVDRLFGKLQGLGVYLPEAQALLAELQLDWRSIAENLMNTAKN